MATPQLAPTDAVRLEQLFLHQAALRPAAPALELPPGSGRAGRWVLSYGRLAERAQDLADALAPLVARQRSLTADTPEVVVGIVLPREALALYEAQLGVLTAGAAFGCLDPRQGDGSLRRFLEEMNPVALLSDEAGARRLAGLGLASLPPVLVLEEITGVDEAGPLDELATAQPGAAASRQAGDPDAMDRASPLAYLIHTSGTTGRPKGVMVEHASILNLVRSDLAHFGLGPGDRVAQCSSPAYDSSIEETWLALAAGATLVVMDDEAVRLGPDLAAWLREERITVFCPPPTLLRASGCRDPQAELPLLRLLYVGGEAVGQDLVDLWAPGRRMVNGYGPTECTVTCTRAELRAGEAVTIGLPVSGNEAYVLDPEDPDGAPLPPGAEGELCIGGRGLARGYRGQPELTAERFPQHPALGRIYRTGDRVRRLPDGQLAYLGRLDAQVKLRGYRIELGAVEACLAAQPGVRAAACRLQGEGAAALLAAHLVPEEPDQPPDPVQLLAALREALPPYMVPTRLAFCAALPTTLGGKLDRAALPLIPAGGPGLASDAGVATSAAIPQAVGIADDPAGGATTEAAKSETGHLATIRRAFASALSLPPSACAPEADFFLDLGGDSLSAVAVVLALRDEGLAAAKVRDLYQAPTVQGLATLLAASGGGPSRAAVASTTEIGEAGGLAAAADIAATHHTAPSPRTGDRRSPPLAPTYPRLCTLAQSLWLLLELWLGGTLAWLLAFRLLPALWEALGPWGLLAAAPVLTVLGFLAGSALALAGTLLAKRLLIGRYRAGRHPVWGSFYLRHWLLQRFARLLPWELLGQTVFLAPLLRALGARVGHRLRVQRGVDLRRAAWDLLDLGDDVVLCQEAAPRTLSLEGGMLHLGPVVLGSGACLDTRAGLGPDAGLAEGSLLGALSWLPPGEGGQANTCYDGIPARPAGPAPALPPVDSGGPPWSPASFGIALVLARLLAPWLRWLPAGALLALLAALPGGAAAELLAEPTVAVVAALLLPCLGLPLGLLLQALALRLTPRVQPGCYAAGGGADLRIALRSEALEQAMAWLSGSLFWPPWLRLAGMRIGPGAEVSSIIDVLPETVSIGSESFFADGVYFCQPRRLPGRVLVADTRLGPGSFLGNHALVQAGLDYPAGFFLGVSTVAGPQQAAEGGDWFGHPPFRLPRREQQPMDRRLTHEPDALRRATRLSFELARFGLPLLPLALALVWWQALAERAAAGASELSMALLWTPVVSALVLALPPLAILVLKWGLLGRVKAGRHAFWSCWCARWDFLYMAWTLWARGLLEGLEGSLLLNAYLRLTGMRIGRRVVLGPGFAQVVDPDMIRLDHGATVSCHFQAHTFEDRVLRIAPLRVGAGATVGPGAVLFYGADVGDGATVLPHAVVMKQDRLAAGGEYGGHPAEGGGDGVRIASSSSSGGGPALPPPPG